MNALQEQFVAEARELIQQATDDLIALEREGFARERVDRVFRAFHTLKGSAGVVDLPAMGLALHAGEDVLAAIRAGRLELNRAIMDEALACLDQVSGWVDEFEARGAISPKAVDAAIATRDRLRALLPGAAAAGGPASIGEDASLPAWARDLIETAAKRGAAAALAPGTEIVAIAYEPRPDCFFNGDDPLQTMRKVPNLLALHFEPVNAWQQGSAFDPYACNLRFQCLAAGSSLAELSALFRLVPDQVRMIEISLSAVAAQTDDTSALVRGIIEEQMRMLRVTCPKDAFAGRASSAARAVVNALRAGSRTEYADEIERARLAALAAADAAPLIDAFERSLFLLTDDAQTEDPSQALEAERGAGRSLRVDESKIDRLGNLAGELLVLKNAVAHLAKRAEDERIDREIARAIRRESDALERLSTELHEAILQLRMVPVAQVFRSFPRLVRDMAQRLDKKIALVTAGEATEADKAIVDRLFEPLLHLVRNAVDHGIEDAAARRAAGKPELATINLRASQAGRRFVVEVTDDGRGIDPDAIRRKAAEGNLLPADRLAALSDDQAIELIFAGGFSTAAQVTDISGRGVGLDVVRSAIARMEGRTSVSSRVGQGTTVRLELPISISMARVMVVEAAGHLFGLPMEAVSETIRLTEDRITRFKNNEGFIWRERIVPICGLAETMNLPPAVRAAAGSRLFAIVESAPRIAALEIDAIGERLEVVLKPMQGMLSGVRGYAGTTLLGDGRVLLVLDPKEILP